MWWPFGPKHTPESVAADLAAGLRDGSVVLDDDQGVDGGLATADTPDSPNPESDRGNRPPARHC